MSRALALGSVVLVVAVAAGCGGRRDGAPSPQVDQAVTSHARAEVKWETDWSRAFERARREGKPVLVNFYAEWCVWCKHLETITFRDQKVAALLAERVVPLSVDIDGDVQQLIRDHRIEAPPTIVVFDPAGAELGRIPGYLPPTGFLGTVERMLAAPPPASS
ncbi:MAG TPA: thioredoxin family protein [Thermoanaerobaculales bacterium]|nr:thioredoxin family protein [Thermoanaerobaculales bacterium]HPA81356.1 thioredoxin family protein [Thermoanaerobaculales bacterium]HQL29367.1 thioredoxin family protein [Thermoanaerobaculales bacterium]HQN96049.1 thioredoxin family protein [Thermoanaerobaculales bacterium]HQP44184.1 thioredoxin family protein [Thermoanaerobaculales bacterium]